MGVRFVLVFCGRAGGVVADGIGALLSARKATGERDYILDYTPQMVNPPAAFPGGDQGWVNLSDAVQAEGGERWLTLGNFDVKGKTRLALSADAPQGCDGLGLCLLDGVEVVPVTRPEDCACLVRKIADEMQDPPEPLTRVEEWSGTRCILSLMSARCSRRTGQT